VEDGGSQVGLTVPSGELRLVSGFTVPQGGSADFTIDFDMRKAVINPQSENQDYKLRPALRMVDNTEVGDIEGTVDGTFAGNQCESTQDFAGAVYVYEGQDAELVDYDSTADKEPLMAATVDVAEGETELTYKAAFLSAGDYTIAYSCDKDDPEADDSDTMTFHGERNVTVEAEATNQEDFDGSQ